MTKPDIKPKTDFTPATAQTGIANAKELTFDMMQEITGGNCNQRKVAWSICYAIGCSAARELQNFMNARINKGRLT